MTAAGNDPLVRVHEVTRRFGAFVAADRVSFDVPRGQIFGFLGPNGSGKSTTIRMLAGLLAPSSGRITGFGGLDVSRDTERWKQRIGYMSQKFSLYLDLTVEENLRFFGTVYGLAKPALRARVADLAARLKFEPLLPALTATLSTGQRQRVALAASLLHEPELLFLDEPTGGVDPRGRRMFWDLIYDLAAARGMTVLVTTHYMDEAEQCDRLAFILHGRIVAEGTPGDLKENLRGRTCADACSTSIRVKTRSPCCRARGVTPRSRTPTCSACACGSWRRPAPPTKPRGSPHPSAPRLARSRRSRTCSYRSPGVMPRRRRR
jgi:ABC-2 type transport system ATP-binding protein